MQMVKLVCPYCGATLSIENGIDTFYCQYCGGKILLTGQSKNIIDAKVKLKEFEHRERLQNNQYAFQERTQKSNQDYEIKKRQNHFLSIFIMLPIIGGVILVVATIIGIVLTTIFGK